MTISDKISLTLSVLSFVGVMLGGVITIYPKLKTLRHEQKKIDSEQQSNIAGAVLSITNAVKVIVDPLEKRIVDLEKRIVDLEEKRQAWEKEKNELESLVKKLTHELDRTKRWAERLVEFILRQNPDAEIPPFDTNPKIR